MKSANDKTFYKVTNADIYEKLLDMENKQIIATNIARKAQVVSTTALTVSLLVLGYFISSLI